ncbi:MAG: SDR family oxidoreductase [Cyanobacteria bacterium P01_A01_bin.105]
MGQPESSNSQPPIAIKPLINAPTPTVEPPRNRRLAGKVALIMGSDGRLDRKIASVYAQQGACIVLCGLHLRRGRSVVQQLLLAGGEGRFVLTDVADALDVQRAVESAVATYGQLDILLNNCQPLAQPETTVQTLSPALWNRTLDVTLGGPFLAVRHAVPFLRRAGHGSIINIAPLPDRGLGLATAVSQSGLVKMTERMAHSLAPCGVRVNLIWPGPPLPSGQADGMPTYVLGHRGQRPERAIARAALYLACADSQALNGSTLRPRWTPPTACN